MSMRVTVKNDDKALTAMVTVQEVSDQNKGAFVREARSLSPGAWHEFVISETAQILVQQAAAPKEATAEAVAEAPAVAEPAS